jgi:DNA-binding transcriptional ArsR family regulator
LTTVFQRRIYALVRTYTHTGSPLPSPGSRRAAARELDAILDAPVFRALCEPARIEILKLLTIHGRSDVGSLAAHLPQDRSVVSRHLALLHRAGLIRREKIGRNVFFEMDGPASARQLEEILERFRKIVPWCCPG